MSLVTRESIERRFNEMGSRLCHAHLRGDGRPSLGRSLCSAATDFTGCCNRLLNRLQQSNLSCNTALSFSNFLYSLLQALTVLQ